MKKNTKTFILCVVMVATLIIPILSSGHADFGSGIVKPMGNDYPVVD